MSKTASFTVAAALAVALATPASAQEPQHQAPPPSADHVKALIQQAMAQTTPGTQVPGAPAGPVANLTIDEAVNRAIEKNLTLASQRLTPRTFDYSIAATLATYRPTLTSLFSNNSATQLPTTTVEGGTVVTTDTQRWNAGVQQ